MVVVDWADERGETRGDAVDRGWVVDSSSPSSCGSAGASTWTCGFSGIRGAGAAGADEAVGEEEEVACICDLGEDASGAVDVLRVLVVWGSPGVRDLDVGGESGSGFEVQDEVKFAEKCFLEVELIRLGLSVGSARVVAVIVIESSCCCISGGCHRGFGRRNFEFNAVGFPEWLCVLDSRGFSNGHLHQFQTEFVRCRRPRHHRVLDQLGCRVHPAEFNVKAVLGIVQSIVV